MIEENYHNIILNTKTGTQLLELLIKIVRSKTWKEDVIKHKQNNRHGNYYFHNDVNGNSRDYVFIIFPNEGSDAQPTNAYVDFHTQPSKWKDLQQYVADPQFPEMRHNFLTQNLIGNDYTDEHYRANVLLNFEIARRVEADTEAYPITTQMTRDAIDAVMNSPGETYAEQVGRLMTMFTAGDIYNDYEGREQAYNEIMGLEPHNDSSDSDVDELVSGIKNL